MLMVSGAELSKSAKGWVQSSLSSEPSVSFLVSSPHLVLNGRLSGCELCSGEYSPVSDTVVLVAQRTSPFLNKQLCIFHPVAFLR